MGPGAQLGTAGIVAYFMRWLTHRLTIKIESMERAMFFLTRAVLLAGIAQEEASGAVKTKLDGALKELEELEKERELKRRKPNDNE